MSSPKAIVFGPTGAVGSSAARTAESLGAHVVLAMRDTSKSIPGLSAEAEKSGNYSRVTADLSKPDTIRDAVTSSGAKAAFFYLDHHNRDGMKGAVAALKDAGITLPVFLSSFTVRGDRASIPQRDYIPYVHAQVELTLIDAFGAEGFVALRPGSFASNNLGFKKGILAGEIGVYYPERPIDNIVPEDIGRVGGTVLAKGVPSDGNRFPYLYGPELLSKEDTIKTIARVIGKPEPTIKSLNDEEALQDWQEQGMPLPIAEHFVRQSSKPIESEYEVAGYAMTLDQCKNVEKYTGKKGTTLAEYVENNKALYSS